MLLAMMNGKLSDEDVDANGCHRRMTQLRQRTADVTQLPIKSSSKTTVYTFEGFLLPEKLLKGLNACGFVHPSPIQLEAIPVGRCGFDMIVQAKSGTGKTVVFSIIALESIRIDCHSVQALILGPTREIVIQISQVITSLSLAGLSKVRCHPFIGGLPIANDKINLKNCHIAVGTPGRIKQLIDEGLLKSKAVRLFVLDEADKLLDENFQESINWIHHKLPSSKQVIATSATYPESLAQLLTKYMQSPTFVRLNVNSLALLGVKQFYRLTDFHPSFQKSFENKIPSLMEILSSLSFGQCFIFSNYQLRAEGLCNRLCKSGWPTTFISGKQEQVQRLEAINKLKQFNCRILVSTDLTARGIDVENVDLVINLDIPWDTETYLHRIGRAGRYGSSGIAVTLVSKGEEETLLKQIQLNGNLKIHPLPVQLNVAFLKNVEPDVSHFDSDVDVGHKIDQCQVIGAGHIESMKNKLNMTMESKVVQRKKLSKRTGTKANYIREFLNVEISKLLEVQRTSSLTSRKTIFTYDQCKQDLKNYSSSSDGFLNELPVTNDIDINKDENDSLALMLTAVGGVLLDDRLDFYKRVKTQLSMVCVDHLSGSRFSCYLRYLAALTLPQIDDGPDGDSDFSRAINR